MNIIFVTGRLSGGGAERVLSLISSELAKRGHAVTIISLLPDSEVFELSDDIEIVQYQGNQKSALTRFIAKSHLVKRTSKAKKGDVVIAFMTGAIILTVLSLLFTSIPIISCERNDPNRNPKSKFKRFLRSVVFLISEGFVFQTNSAKEYFPTRIQKKSIVIANPLNPELSRFTSVCYKKTIVSVGRLEDVKNYAMSITAFSIFHKKFPEYIYEIYGTGSQKSALIKLISSLNLSDSVILKGFSNEVYKDISGASMYILTSYYEGMPNALMESLALGIPSISTIHPIGGASNLIQNGINGLLVPQNGINELVDAMTKIVKDPILAKKISENSKKIWDQYSISVIGSLWEKYLDRFDKSVGGKHYKND